MSEHFDLDALIVYQSLTPKIRLGNFNDGGYVVCEAETYDCFLSGGVATNTSFEEALLDKYPELSCRTYDGTIDCLPNPRDRMSFDKRNISSLESEHTTNLHALLTEHLNVFVKMDVEGSEYEWIAALSDEMLSHIRQLVVEIHWPFEPEKWSVLTRLAKSHWLIHLHPNNCAGVSHVNGVDVPDVFECTYLHKSVGILRRSRDSIPTYIDQQNHPGIPDILLRGHPYSATE
jgi:hypothetical protein